MFRFSKSLTNIYSRTFLPIRSTSTKSFKNRFFKIPHSTVWKLERIVVLSMFPLIPVSFFLLDEAADSMLVAVTTFHSHHGIKSITVDYIRKFPRLTFLAVKGISASIFIGLMFMIHLRGQGLIMTMRKIWAIEPYKDRGDFEGDYDYWEDVRTDDDK